MKALRTGDRDHKPGSAAVTAVALVLLVLVIYFWASLWVGTAPVF
jgi:hypothetical protein